jgi:hypothetical protein
MKDKFFLLNGRSYPDTVTSGPLATQSSDGRVHYSQPLPAITIFLLAVKPSFESRTWTFRNIRHWRHWGFP